MSSGEPFVSLTLEMFSSLEENLANRSESFPDHGLRVLLLGMERHMSVLARRIEDYYLQVSWAPPLCFGRNDNSSCLPRFESEFHKTFCPKALKGARP